MPLKIVRPGDLRTVSAPATGVYVGPDRGKPIGPDTRFFKAGSAIPPTYRFSHERGARPDSVPDAAPSSRKKLQFENA